MQNISNDLSTESSSLVAPNNSSNASLLSHCKTCNVIGDDKVITYHKYNCPKKQVSCNKCLTEISIQEISTHQDICEEQEIQYHFGASNFDTFMIKKSVLSSIKLAEEILNGDCSFSESEKIKIYKKAIISYNKLIDKFNSKSCKFPWKTNGIISHNEYEKIVNENIKLEKHQLSLQATIESTSALDKNIEDEITKKYLQKKIKYKMYDLPEVEITVGELLHIKLAAVKASCDSSNDIDDSNIANLEDDILFYQQAITIYKELITNLEINNSRKRSEFNEYLYLISNIQKNNTSHKVYHIKDKVKIQVPEKPLISTNFPLILSNSAGVFSNNISGKLFSLLSVNKLKDCVLGTFQPALHDFSTGIKIEYDITIKINSISNYHTDEDMGIYLLLTNTKASFMARRYPDDTTYKLAVSYIDKDDYKNFIFDICFTAKELFDNLCCTDEFDKITKFGFVNRSKKMEQLNRFFNDDGVGTEYIKKHGCDSIFAIEFYRSELLHPKGRGFTALFGK